MSQSVSYTIDGDIGVITVNNPPVNALSQHVRQGLHECFTAADTDATVATILICDGRTFIAGADITEFGKPMKPPHFSVTLKAMEDLSKPVIAAIHGTALGGGLETALCCHYRVAVPSAKVGLPEVHLGLLPGAGGTQRLPRLIGAQAAADAIANGGHINAPAAHAAGVIDALVDEGDLLEGAKAFARKVISEGAQLRKVRDMNDKVTGVDPAIFEAARATARKTRRGFLAPINCIASVEAACTLPFDEGLQREQELFQELHDSVQSAAQQHIFFSERAASKVNDMPKDVGLYDIKHVGVIGAGTMGGGIAMNFANVGIPVTLLEVKQEYLDKGLQVVRDNYERTAKKGRISAAEVEERMGLITPTLDYSDVAEVDMVIEAVYENMDLKKEVFGKLDEVAKPECILATNTSTLDVDAIAAVTKRPEMVIGTHFFSPANIMRLLEVVRGERTAKDVVATTMSLGKRIGKVPALSGVGYGFIGNRMLEDYVRESQMLLLEGATPAQVVGVLEKWGMAMGPCAVMDLAGQDVSFLTRDQNRHLLPDDPRYCVPGDLMNALGRFGQKTRRGFYQYPDGRTRKNDPEAVTLIKKAAMGLGVRQRNDISDEEIFSRCIHALVNRGAQLLDDGIALRASDIDVIWSAGYGFPAYRGGPMFFGSTIGLSAPVDAFKDHEKNLSNDFGYWTPAPLLVKLASENKTFADFDAGRRGGA